MSTLGIVLIGVGSAVVGAVGGFMTCVGLVLHLCNVSEDEPKNKEV